MAAGVLRAIKHVVFSLWGVGGRKAKLHLGILNITLHIKLGVIHESL